MRLVLRSILLLNLILGAFQVKSQNALVTDKRALHFIVLGDWGHRGTAFQKQVAAGMEKTARVAGVDFVISTGDNFYPRGVVDVYDSLWKQSFEKIYTASSMQVPWYPVLGNHDYQGNPDAQVAYSQVSQRWVMPGRYYSKKFKINGDSTNQILFAFIDTNPFVRRYYKDNRHDVHSQNTATQKQWLENTLSDTSCYVKWKIVVGHHPMYTGGNRRYAHDIRNIRRSFKRTCDRFNADAYISGHEHSLQHIGPIKGVHHFISGAGATRTKPEGP